MGYKTTHAILDSLDNDQYYYGGAFYPRPGFVVSQERLDELAEKGHIVKIDDEPSLPAKEEEKPAVEDPTIDEIKAALDDLGIKYSSRAKKAELLELLKGA
ncbi:TPA: HeH/LEM domain-containing protein [Streptococcus suis]